MADMLCTVSTSTESNGMCRPIDLLQKRAFYNPVSVLGKQEEVGDIDKTNKGIKKAEGAGRENGEIFSLLWNLTCPDRQVGEDGLSVFREDV